MVYNTALNCGMMGGWGYGLSWLPMALYTILFTILLIGLILLIFVWIMKLWKENRQKGDTLKIGRNRKKKDKDGNNKVKL